MDWTVVRKLGTEGFRKYRYALLAVFAGLLLLTLPPKSPPQPSGPGPGPSAEQRLAQILSRVEGAGKVEVLLTKRAGEEVIFQTDQDTASDSRRTQTVVISDGQRQEQGLIRQVNPPVYLGAVILCQGADRPAVRLAVVEAVSRSTGLGASEISVLKMK